MNARANECGDRRIKWCSSICFQNYSSEVYLFQQFYSFNKYFEQYVMNEWLHHIAKMTHYGYHIPWIYSYSNNSHKANWNRNLQAEHAWRKPDAPLKNSTKQSWHLIRLLILVLFFFLLWKEMKYWLNFFPKNHWEVSNKIWISIQGHLVSALVSFYLF